MSASAGMSSWWFGIVSTTRGPSLDVSGSSGGLIALDGRHGSCLLCM